MIGKPNSLLSELSSSFELPELGSSFKQDQKAVPGLFTKDAGAKTSSFGSTMATAAPEAAAKLLEGIYQAKLLQEKTQRDIESEAAATSAAGKFQDLSKMISGQISPLKELIANYRAAIK